MTNLPISGQFNITAIFGQQGKYWANGHKGVDITSKNKSIYATCDGTVRVVAYDKDGWGNYISIGDANGQRHIFCHLDSVFVKKGDKVSRKTVIGIMGTTGNSTGVHLHYQINNSKDTPIDPCVHLGVPNKVGAYNSEDYHIGGKAMNYKDENKISSWAKESVEKVTKLGIMNGDTNGNFNPKANITREEVAVIVANLLDK